MEINYKQLRLDNGTKLNDVADKFKVSRQFIYNCEKRNSFPLEIKLFYLKFDKQKYKKVIEFLEYELKQK